MRSRLPAIKVCPSCSFLQVIGRAKAMLGASWVQKSRGFLKRTSGLPLSDCSDILQFPFAFPNFIPTVLGQPIPLSATLDTSLRIIHEFNRGGDERVDDIDGMEQQPFKRKLSTPLDPSSQADHPTVHPPFPLVLARTPARSCPYHIEDHNNTTNSFMIPDDHFLTTTSGLSPTPSSRSALDATPELENDPFEPTPVIPQLMTPENLSPAPSASIFELACDLFFAETPNQSLPSPSNPDQQVIRYRSLSGAFSDDEDACEDRF